MDHAQLVSVQQKLSAWFPGEGRVSGRRLQDQRVAFEVKGVGLPRGCVPQTTDVLLLYPAGPDPPLVMVKDQVTLPSGKTPRSTSSQQVDGLAWIGFSANFPYSPNDAPWFYILGKLKRFEQPD